MEAFQATLEETLEANLLLLVVDVSSPDWLFQLDTVNDLLDSLGITSTRQVVANKIDCCESSSLEAINCLNKDVIYVSATSGAGLQGLKSWLQEKFWGQCCWCECSANVANAATNDECSANAATNLAANATALATNAAANAAAMLRMPVRIVLRMLNCECSEWSCC